MTTLVFAAFSSVPPKAAAATVNWMTYLASKARTGYDSAETVITPSTAPGLKLRTSDAAAGAVSAEPVEVNGVVYWGSWDGYERATNSSNVTSWKTYLGKTTDTSCNPPTVGVASTATVTTVTINGTATLVDFVGGGNGYFYALNASTGAVVWKTLLGSPPDYFLWSSPAYYNGSIYEGVASFGDCPLVRGEFVQLDAATGAVQHVFHTVPSGCTGASVWGSPAIDTGTGDVYFATGNSGSCSVGETLATAVVEVHASDLSMVSHWQLPSSQHGPDSDFGTTPTLFTATIGGTLYHLVGLQNKNGVYYTFNRASIGSGPIWRASVAIAGECPECGKGDISPSAWDGKTLYVGGGNTTINGVSCLGSLRALNPASGALIWQRCLTSGPVLGAVTAVPGVVFAGTGTYMLAASASSGATLFQYHDTNSGSNFWGAASIANGIVYIGNQDGRLYAFGT